MPASDLERELYPVGEAARLLRVPQSTLRWWLEGRVVRDKQYPPVIREAPTGSGLVTWGEFVEAGYLREYRSRSVPLPELRRFIDGLRQELHIRYPLAHLQPFVSAHRRLVLEVQKAAGLPPEFGLVLEVTSGQLLLGRAAESFVERVEFSPEGEQPAVRLFPVGRESPVVIDPKRAFGAPSIKGIRTDALVELIDAGESPEEVADNFELPIEAVKAAVAYEWTMAA
jgi:uncharacterized protein (DUF433 family)